MNSKYLFLRANKYYTFKWASLVAQMVERLSAMQETRVWSLGWEDPLEKEMAAHSSILAWKIPWIAEPGRLPSMGSQRVGHNACCSCRGYIVFLLGSSVKAYLWKSKPGLYISYLFHRRNIHNAIQIFK